MGDEATKVFLNTMSEMDDVDDELRNFLEYAAGKEPADEFTKELDSAVIMARKNKEWRLQYMTQKVRDMEYYEEGREEGREEVRIEDARNMIAENLSDELINRVTKLPLEKIQQLREEMSVQC